MLHVLFPAQKHFVRLHISLGGLKDYRWTSKTTTKLLINRRRVYVVAMTNVETTEVMLFMSFVFHLYVLYL